MGFLSKIKDLIAKPEKKISACVTFYPDKIIVVTNDITTTGLGLVSLKFTSLPTDVSPEVFGQVLRKHFELVQFDVPHPKDLKKEWKEYKIAAGFTTDKSTYQDARLVNCSISKGTIILCPSENLYNTGFEYLTKFQVVLQLDISDKDLGVELFKIKELSFG